MEDGLGPEEPMPDPTLSDLGLGGSGAPLVPTRCRRWPRRCPAAMGAFPPGGLGGGWGADPFSSLAGAAGAPLAGLASQLGDQPRRDDTSSATTASEASPRCAETDSTIASRKHQQPQADSATGRATAAAGTGGTPGDGAPPAAPAATRAGADHGGVTARRFDGHREDGGAGTSR